MVEAVKITPQKTKAEIVAETIEHIRVHGRCMSEGHCIYLHDDGNACAVGRCMAPEMQRKYCCSNKAAVTIIEDDGQAVFLPEYRGHNAKFWMDLQSFHDSFSVWDGNKLTQLGEQYAKEILAETTETTEVAA